MKFILVKRENASELILTMMIWAVASLLGTRLFLKMTGYPEIGRGSWHVAHALWGGIIMLLAALLVFGFQGNKLMKWVAGIFGVGAGLFIDEIGKFLSRDNNYFFQPAIILIYLMFVVLFLVYRYLERTEPKDLKAKLHQIIGQLEDVAEGNIDKNKKKKILRNLNLIIKKADDNNKVFAENLKTMVEQMKVKEKKEEPMFTRFWQGLRRFAYRKVFKNKLALGLMMILAIYFIAGGVMDGWYIMSKFRDARLFGYWFDDFLISSRTDVVMFRLMTISSILASLLFLAGLWQMIWNKKRRGIRYFQYGLLINIFLASVFKFYFEQFSGIFSLGLSIAIYYGLDRLRKEVVI